MKFIRKALLPAALVTGALALFGGVLSAETLSDVTSASGDDVVVTGEDTAIWVEVTPDAAAEDADAAAVRAALDDLDGATEVLAVVNGASALEDALRVVFPDDLDETQGTD